MRSWTSLAAAAAALAAGAGLGLYLLRRQRRMLALPAPAEVPLDTAAEEPISRETRYDEELDEEERRRHEAAERLRADPLNERLDGGDTEA
jgi:hypothetical protein